MKRFRADVTVLPKDGVLDTQGKAVERTLRSHGYEAVSGVRVGRFVRFVVEAPDESSAGEIVRAAADDLLVNDLIESCTFTLEQLP
ncbi:MAG: phosphoribosylformylglycinamidine synthase subunit PurS [Synergistaceae bacterium]|jgi:phosphoribosylformylglycinamidine synthase PurS subunit|nr:phosphoribosylformylglycinamidine synthase subunit PurS [Synergistaceae bacterium]